MRIQANQHDIRRAVPLLRELGSCEDGWTTRFLDPVTGEVWRRTYLGSARGGMPILVKEPMPGVSELIELAANSAAAGETAASAWLLSELDSEGDYKESLLAVAERAASADDHLRAALLVGWRDLLGERISVEFLGSCMPR